MSPLVSVLVPCFNAELYVAEAIHSALTQTWPNIEVVVVDDGSTDNSGSVLDSFTTRRVKVIHQDNKGQSAAANRAFQESSGDYIKFFDADDLVHTELIERQMRRLSDDTFAVAS